MYKENWRDQGLTGNDKYEGYCIDLLDAIASSEHFDNNMKYVIREVADNSYGRKDADGRWNGMIGELLSGVRRGCCSCYYRINSIVDGRANLPWFIFTRDHLKGTLFIELQGKKKDTSNWSCRRRRS